MTCPNLITLHALYILSYIQLTNQTYVDAMDRLSQTIEVTENNTNEQTDEVLGTVASYLDNLANFVNESNVIIDTNVSVNDMQSAPPIPPPTHTN